MPTQPALLNPLANYRLAGLAAFFGEPLGGALFGCEVIHRYGVEYFEALIPSVVAGLTCNSVFRFLT